MLDLTLTIFAMFCAENYHIQKNPQRRRSALAVRRSRAQRQKAPKRAPIGPGPTVAVPVCWYLQPLYHNLKKLIRPPTSRTRRKLLEVYLPLPRELFELFMAPVLDGDATYLADSTKTLERDEAGTLVPTKVSQQLRQFNYIIRRPMVTDRLVQLQQADLKPGPSARPGKAGRPWRRGMARRG